MTVSGECDPGGYDDAMERDQEQATSASDSGRDRRSPITGRPQPSAATDYMSAEASSASPSKSPIMKSSMSSRLGFPSKTAGQADEDVECPCSPASSTGLSFHQDSQPTPQGDDVLLAGRTPASLGGGSQNDQEDKLSQQMSIPPCTSKEERVALATAMPHPPVTKETLEELGLEWIQSNIILRININYDHRLEFMRDGGIRGEQKRKEARKYWLSLEAELRIMYQHNLSALCAECDDVCSARPIKSSYFTPRLPLMFLTLKELLTVLIPDGEQGQLVQFLDIPLLLQELSHGLMDIVRLSGWIRQLLTSHCAPMRDQAAQEMAQQIRDGAETGDVHTLVAGIEKLFVLLEAMQLDVANHQVRNLREFFIDDTVAFQQAYFRARINNGQLNVNESQRWYRRTLQAHQANCHTVGEEPADLSLASVIHGLIGLCFAPDTPIPETLRYDTSRLRTISAQFYDMVYVDLSLLFFDRLVQRLSGPAGNPSIMHAVLRTRLLILTDSDAASDHGVPENWRRHANAVALELTRAAFQYCQGANSAVPETEVAKMAEEVTGQFRFERHTRSHAQAVAKVLEKTALDYARVYQGVPPRVISLAQQGMGLRHPPSQVCRDLPDIVDLGSRLAHIVVIHWRVWAELVYTQDCEESEEDEEDEEDDENRTSSWTDDTMESVQQGPGR